MGLLDSPFQQIPFCVCAGNAPGLYFLKDLFFFDRLPLKIFLFSYLAAAVFWPEQEVIVDASRYFTQAKHLELYGPWYFIREWGKEIQAWTDQPLIPFLYGLVFRLFGESRILIQAFTALLFSSTVLLTYLIGKALWDRETGAGAGWLFLGIPYLFTQAPLMLVDVPTMFFFTFSTYAFIRALQSGKLSGWVLLSAIAITCTIFSKYSTGLMLSVLPVAFAIFFAKSPERKTVLRNALAVLVISVLLSMPLLILKWDVISGQIRLLSSYQVPGLKRWGETFRSTFLFQTHPLISVFVLFSFYRFLRTRDLNFLLLAFLPLLVMATGLRRIRYMIMVFPFVALMASYGIMLIKSIPVRRFLILSVLATSLSLAIAGFLPYLEKESSVNLKEAGNFLDKTDVPGVEVFTMTWDSPVNAAVSVPILDLFTKKQIYFNYINPYLKTGLPADILKSPLRFTWEYRNPKYYENETLPSGRAILLISTQSGAALTPEMIEKTAGYRKIIHFEKNTGIFRFQTFVTLYLP